MNELSEIMAWVSSGFAMASAIYTLAMGIRYDKNIKLRVTGSSPACRSWKRGFLMTDFLFFAIYKHFMAWEED